jgi:hypothetical protein
MEPTNDRERLIAQAVDTEFQNSPRGPYEAVVSEVAVSLGFLTSDADANFLVSYSQWRFENPIVKRKAKAAATNDSFGRAVAGRIQSR